MAIDPEANAPLVGLVTEALRQFIIANPDATIEQCIGVIMSFGLAQETAEEAITLIGEKFAEIHGVPLSFDEIKVEAVEAAQLLPDDEAALTSALEQLP